MQTEWLKLLLYKFSAEPRIERKKVSTLMRSVKNPLYL